MAVGNGRTLTKDFHQLLKNVHGMSGGQVVVTEWEDDLASINLTVTPTDGYYKGGQYGFIIRPSRGEDLRVPPRVYCETMIYHPNIDTLEDDGEICLNLLEDDMWTEDMNLEDVVQGILFLLYNPNLQDPLTCVFQPDMSEEEFVENVRLSIAGGCVDGYQFPKPKIRGVECEEERVKTEDEVSKGTMQVREEPDGAEEVPVSEDAGGEDKNQDIINIETMNRINSTEMDNADGAEETRVEKECGEDKIKEEIKTMNRINSTGIEEVSNKFEPEWHAIDTDEGTPVDPPFHVQNKASNNNDAISTKIVDKAVLDPTLGEESGKRVHRFNFWLGIAIRRVRTWNVFWL